MTFQPGEGITGIHLTLSAKVPGLDEADFQRIAEDAKTGCPVSQALTVPCTVAHDAEVISVARDPDEFPMVQREGTRYPDLHACEEAAYPFLGVRALNEAGDRSDLLGPWWPATMGT